MRRIKRYTEGKQHGEVAGVEVMCFGKQAQFNVSFNDKEIEHVERYKYLGNIICRKDKPTQDT